MSARPRSVHPSGPRGLRTPRRELCDFAATHLARPRPVRWHRTGHEAVVLEVRSRGRSWFVKQVGRPEVWQREAAAYDAWSPGLASRLPRLVARCPVRRLLLLTAVPGRPAEPHQVELYRPAGRLLARVQDQPPPTGDSGGPDTWSAYVRALAAQVDLDLARLQRHGVSVDTEVACRALAELATLEAPLRSCHGDFLPRNWMGEDGRLHLIDLGMAARRPVTAAFSRLHVRTLWRHPRLTEEFLAGYGSGLDAEERRAVELHRAADAVILMRWGARRDAGHAVQRGREVLAAVRRDEPLGARPGWQ